jgi:RNA polymerase sigma-70 factor, ECF subfamily
VLFLNPGPELVRSDPKMQARAEARREPGEIEPQGEVADVVPLSDRVLLERHGRGDPQAFAELVRMYEGPVYGYLARLGVPATERDDLFQEVFCKVHRFAARSLPDGAVKPWLFAIAVNAARDSFRRAKVRSIVRLDESAGSELADETRHAAPDTAAEARETAALLDREMAKCSLDEREVLLLVCVEGMSLEETARAVDAPVNTVKTRLRRARLALAEALRRRQLAVQREGSR